ncbi:type I phosphodiesterase/nucleotide pyrophosphatase [Beutenbergia cavernae DSM 12333]|uniref:Type I phosphodiesterase/nucleotide pyrophosphatase n=1 Tax=Beutenbergia cavernae (strain ATCC BAA-8 / DSM 12333 / CCUG 43141 / JCM 11478 / NBRC 16432 / NCIMB 13614 / HKI 0122) TaxID=471853 RepID=C5C5J6_BEUC1|nr:nucleotide pyrophosphatase/phosphodiesterase family protein [Beutenbergia cavernae]ACQ80187.1 type I phosphodiesterase/nucleotide pyrophosphatase [Beutenbergia cavernae DSM 12333]
MSTAPAAPADLLPPTATPGLAGVLGDAARSLGTEVGGPSAGLALAPGSRVCVVLVDGLGWEAVQARLGHAPVLRGLVRGGEPVRAPYPSTTAASLATFATGVLPGRTGMLGYTVRSPLTGGLLNLVSWNAHPGPPPEPTAWQREPTTFEALVAAGSTVTSLGPTRFAGSGLTRAALRGPAFVGADALEDRVDAALAALRRPGLVYLYWGDLDKVGHHEGWSSPEWGEHLGMVDAALGQLLRRAPRGTTVIVCADHGMVDVTSRVDVADVPHLSAGVQLVAGEPRASHVYCEPGEADAVAARWRDVLGDAAWVLTRAEAIAAGLFGEVAQRFHDVVGDVVVAAAGTTAIVDSRTQTPASIGLIGMHGSLTSAETLVPAVVEVT